MAGLAAAAAAGAFLPMIMKSLGIGGGRSRGAGRSLCYGGRRQRQRGHCRYRGGGGVRGMRWGYTGDVGHVDIGISVKEEQDM